MLDTTPHSSRESLRYLSPMAKWKYNALALPSHKLPTACSTLKTREEAENDFRERTCSIEVQYFET